jgi:SAM-dependent methyltransferase
MPPDHSQTPTALYDAAFFQSHREGSRISAAEVVPLIIELFRPASVVDVGCGTGLWLSAFRERGIGDVLGIDGPWLESTQLEMPRELFRQHDLTQPLRLDRKFDLAVCLEVAEHIPTEAARFLVESLTRLSPVVIFSAAIPRQGGEGHINEQWPSFWSDQFAACGYSASTCLRHRLWTAGDAIEVWYRQNILCFLADGTSPIRERSPQTESRPAAEPLDVVHPDLYLRRASDLEQWKGYAGRLERQVQATKAELAEMRNSRPWRFYQALRPALIMTRRFRSRLRMRPLSGIRSANGTD